MLKVSPFFHSSVAECHGFSYIGEKCHVFSENLREIQDNSGLDAIGLSLSTLEKKLIASSLSPIISLCQPMMPKIIHFTPQNDTLLHLELPQSVYNQRKDTI